MYISPYTRPMCIDINSLIFDNEDREDHAYDEHTLAERFPVKRARDLFMTFWMSRTIVPEQSLDWSALPRRLQNHLRRIGLYDFVLSPGSTVTMNRSVVREYYAILHSGQFLNKDPTMRHKLRGVDVRINANWINTHYGIPEVPAAEDMFDYDGSRIQLRDQDVRLREHLASLFGRTHLWPSLQMSRCGVVEDVPGELPDAWVSILLLFFGNRVYGTIHTSQPNFEMYLLVYAMMKGRVNIGKYILHTLARIAWTSHGDGYAWYPHLITSLASDFHVPVYDTDDIEVATTPLVYEEHPWFV